ncbi:hypothetical protein JCGZ_13178 [Jatropha curcas]|uniref:25S rRNA (uridine-N(3))-methyltransferase BMT5-like domain-containing protein n=1 Tax=Jatropha curcas TaxID=180498 RepID=A0A067KC78_JATCU|nr:hypothetical protein JCGZ_13178 [Jatropha curcas]
MQLACCDLTGEIHVSHKTTSPFCYWKIEELACRNFLSLIERTDFKIQDYAGYQNKRGHGIRCDEPFGLGHCSNFKFAIKKCSRVINHFIGRRPSFLQFRHFNYASETYDRRDYERYVKTPLRIIIRRKESVNASNGYSSCGPDSEEKWRRKVHGKCYAKKITR